MADFDPFDTRPVDVRPNEEIEMPDYTREDMPIEEEEETSLIDPPPGTSQSPDTTRQGIELHAGKIDSVIKKT